MELEIKCLVGLKLSCLITHRMFQSMEFSPHLESSRVLFILFINDISSSVQSTLLLFADCVLYREVVTHRDCLVLQQDLHRLFLWSKTWRNGKTCIRGSQSHDCNRQKSTAPSPVKAEVKKGLKHFVKLWTLRFCKSWTIPLRQRAIVTHNNSYRGQEGHISREHFQLDRNRKGKRLQIVVCLEPFV